MNYRYGLLRYSTLNIGDEIQSIAARRFLPRVDLYLDRDYLSDVNSEQKIRLIMNGWFASRPENWPPSPDVEPLFVSFHISERAHKELTSDRSVEYFKQHQPIGCRDHVTRDVLREKGAEAYFSGCLTLTLRSRATKRTDEVLLSDLDDEVMQHIPPDLLTRSFTVHHGSDVVAPISRTVYRFSPALHRTIKATKAHRALSSLQQFMTRRAGEGRTVIRFKQAEELLARYARAKLVITSRIHCALPCLAFGTPVIFVNRNLEDPRFTGFLEYMRSYSVENFKHEIHRIDVENPQPNPKSIDKLREDLIRTCETFITED